MQNPEKTFIGLPAPSTSFGINSALCEAWVRNLANNNTKLAVSGVAFSEAWATLV